MRVFVLIACFCVAMLALPSKVFASDINRAWLDTFGVSGGEYPIVSTVDSKGAVYMVSDEYYTNIGNLWQIRKLNSLGQLQWSQQFFATDAPAAVAADSYGNLFVTGSAIYDGEENIITIKFLTNGDVGWINSYPNGYGRAIYVDPSNNVYVGAYGGDNPVKAVLLEYSNAGMYLNSATQSAVAAGTFFFMPNGNLVCSGSVPNSQNPAYMVLSNTGTVLFQGSLTNDNSNSYSYTLACDPGSNLYVAAHDFQNLSADAYYLSCLSPTGASIWNTPIESGSPRQISASDSNHAYVSVSTDSNTYNVLGFKTGGVEFFNEQYAGGTIAVDGTEGLVTVSATLTTFTFSEVNQDLQTLWTQTVSDGNNDGVYNLTAIKGTVYCMLGVVPAAGSSTAFVKFVQGVGVTTVTPAAPQIQGGKSVNVTVQLNDVAPSAGMTCYFVSSLPVLGLPASVVIPAGKSSLTVTALTDPVDVATPVSIAAEVNGGVRTTTVTVNPAVLSTVTFPGGTNASVVGGQTITGTITLTGPTALLAHTVTLSSNSAKATVPASVNVVAGASSATFVVHTTTVTSSTTVMVTAKLAGVTVTGKLSVTP